jgi:outer membrane protein assembly factor BamD (BamD/ComL family)
VRRKVTTTPAIPKPEAEPASTPLDLAWKAYGAGDLAEASRMTDALLVENPTDLEAAYLAGLSHKAQGQADRARQAFQTVIAQYDSVDDSTRGRMLRRLAVGHMNQMERGAWDLEPETWERR